MKAFLTFNYKSALNFQLFEIIWGGNKKYYSFKIIKYKENVIKKINDVNDSYLHVHVM